MNEALVTTAWVAERLDTSSVRIIDVPSSVDGYESGHIPGAAKIEWKRELIPYEDESSGDVPGPERFAALARRLGLRRDDAIVFYGDEGGRHAVRALWMFAYYKHLGPLHWMDGGREKWRAEGRPLTTETPPLAPSDYPVPSGREPGIRIRLEEIQARLGQPSLVVLDVRTDGEYEGSDVRAARGGHIPGAVHIFWEDALQADRSLRPREELERLFASVPRDATVAVHCQLGVRAAHTWFVLRHVLGYEDVRNYDGSWQEWGNREETPVEA